MNFCEASGTESPTREVAIDDPVLPIMQTRFRQPERFSPSVLRVTLLAALFTGTLTACGGIVNKERIPIASYDGVPVTRGELADVLREMPDEDRPLIQTKEDLLRALNAYLDERVKADIAEELIDARKIDVKREIAIAAYFKKFPERYRYYTVQNPDEATLLRMGITPEELVAVKADMEFAIDDIEKELLRDIAIDYLVFQESREPTIAITDADYQSALEVRGGSITSLENIFVYAILFPTRFPDAVKEAAAARRRVDEGESFENVAAAFHNKPESTTIRVGFENDPTSQKYRTFWDIASGSRAGDILGPLFLPPFEEVSKIEGGRTRAKRIEQSHVVLQIVEHNPAFELNWEQAKEALHDAVVREKIMEKLRSEHGVQIFEDKLPDPAGFGDQFKKNMIETG